jgi:hypothetical protein
VPERWGGYLICQILFEEIKALFHGFKSNYLKMSASYFFGSSSPAIAYSPHYAAGYSALSGLKTRVVHKCLPNALVERLIDVKIKNILILSKVLLRRARRKTISFFLEKIYSTLSVKKNA